MEKEIINRVAASGLITFDLEELYVVGERVFFDVKDLLFEGMILREKDVREFVRSHDWSLYAGKLVAVGCSTDAIIPTWAYMLLSVALRPYASKVVFGDVAHLESVVFSEALSSVNWSQYRDARVVVKGCSKVDVPVSAYVEVVNRLQPLASSIMFGEACSTVPLYKRPKA